MPFVASVSNDLPFGNLQQRLNSARALRKYQFGDARGQLGYVEFVGLGQIRSTMRADR
jgi:hypothetical protein